MDPLPLSTFVARWLDTHYPVAARYAKMSCGDQIAALDTATRSALLELYDLQVTTIEQYSDDKHLDEVWYEIKAYFSPLRWTSDSIKDPHVTPSVTSWYSVWHYLQALWRPTPTEYRYFITFTLDPTKGTPSQDTFEQTVRKQLGRSVMSSAMYSIEHPQTNMHAHALVQVNHNLTASNFESYSKRYGHVRIDRVARDNGIQAYMEKENPIHEKYCPDCKSLNCSGKSHPILWRQRSTSTAASHPSLATPSLSSRPPVQLPSVPSQPEL